jgi:enamine deaminase RidA (YjgF/YER057c/UK114 family)
MARNLVTVGKPWESGKPFAQGVIASGRMLYTSGIVARGREGALVGIGDVRAQILQCFSNLGDVLQAAGSDWQDIVKYTIYTTDIRAAQHAAPEVVPKYFVGRPASTLVEVRSLVEPQMLVELEAIVALDR